MYTQRIHILYKINTDVKRRIIQLVLLTLTINFHSLSIPLLSFNFSKSWIVMREINEGIGRVWLPAD